MKNIIEPVNRMTANLQLGLVLSDYRGADVSRRWAFIRRVNWATNDKLGKHLIEHGTHVIVMGRRDHEGYVEYARELGKPVRVVTY